MTHKPHRALSQISRGKYPPEVKKTIVEPSWESSPLMFKDFFFASHWSLFPFTTANAWWGLWPSLALLLSIFSELIVYSYSYFNLRCRTQQDCKVICFWVAVNPLQFGDINFKVVSARECYKTSETFTFVVVWPKCRASWLSFAVFSNEISHIG